MGHLKKERIGRDPLKLVRANRRFRAWWQCHFGSLSGESTIQFPAISSACAPFHEGWPYQTAVGGSMCRNPSPPPPVLDKSTPLSLCLSLCNTSVLNTRHIRVTLLSRTVHTRFFHSIQFLPRTNVQIAKLPVHSFYSNRVAWTVFQNSRVEERMVNSLRLN